jgi:hypothetical protein
MEYAEAILLQLFMIEIMKAKVPIEFKFPCELAKAIERTRQLPIQMKCDPILLQEVKDYLGLFLK